MSRFKKIGVSGTLNLLPKKDFFKIQKNRGFCQTLNLRPKKDFFKIQTIGV